MNADQTTDPTTPAQRPGGGVHDWLTGLIRAATAGRPTDPTQPPQSGGQPPREGPDLADLVLLGRAAVTLGTAQRALVLARHRAGARFVGGRPLIERQSTGHRLARGSAQIAVVRATVLAAGRDEDAGIAARYRAPASAAAAAEAAFACAQALVQVYGAAGTSDPEATAAFEACQAAATAVGPAPGLWLRAGRRRAPDLPAARTV